MSTPEGLCTKCSASQYCDEHEPGAPAPAAPEIDGIAGASPFASRKAPPRGDEVRGTSALVEPDHEVWEYDGAPIFDAQDVGNAYLAGVKQGRTERKAEGVPAPAQGEPLTDRELADRVELAGLRAENARLREQLAAGIAVWKKHAQGGPIERPEPTADDLADAFDRLLTATTRAWNAVLADAQRVAFVAGWDAGVPAVAEVQRTEPQPET